MKRIFTPLIAQHRKVTTALAIAAMQSSAFALGGLEKAKSAAESIKTGLYALVGVVAIIYLIYLGVMAFTEKKSWADFGWGVMYVSLVGAATALGSWAWTLFAA
ncbi:hypothetical protein D5041_21410 (plasmid) [Verminephrobacter aporrectodeae subsp. tuberculatae]|uniref:TrbC/VirB2 family protein n=1 Tax=Verminephrobacter aporrectodeae TaxID=1110389 RepID=UPI00223899D8|nr:TrbC/VirB2 family protein [Verminephrobacter aporrectodeae]MCW5223653.1 hypothetical protein [Verminephrobacter aporrectodeae subsp. tuberculatae]MCW5291483.1 hypothetical protein [Verminephrobacter aporrectodeae subsp. tuberculatae]